MPGPTSAPNQRTVTVAGTSSTPSTSSRTVRPREMRATNSPTNGDDKSNGTGPNDVSGSGNSSGNGAGSNTDSTTGNAGTNTNTDVAANPGPGGEEVDIIANEMKSKGEEGAREMLRRATPGSRATVEAAIEAHVSLDGSMLAAVVAALDGFGE